MCSWLLLLFCIIELWFCVHPWLLDWLLVENELIIKVESVKFVVGSAEFVTCCRKNLKNKVLEFGCPNWIFNCSWLLGYDVYWFLSYWTEVWTSYNHLEVLWVDSWFQNRILSWLQNLENLEIFWFCIILLNFESA